MDMLVASSDPWTRKVWLLISVSFEMWASTVNRLQAGLAQITMHHQLNSWRYQRKVEQSASAEKWKLSYCSISFQLFTSVIVSHKERMKTEDICDMKRHWRILYEVFTYFPLSSLWIPNKYKLTEWITMKVRCAVFGSETFFLVVAFLLSLSRSFIFQLLLFISPASQPLDKSSTHKTSNKLHVRMVLAHVVVEVNLLPVSSLSISQLSVHLTNRKLKNVTYRTNETFSFHLKWNLNVSWVESACHCWWLVKLT